MIDSERVLGEPAAAGGATELQPGTPAHDKNYQK